MPDDRRPTKDAVVSGAARVLAALRYLGEAPNGASLQEVTAALDSPKTSVHRALGQLVAAGFVSQDEDSRYRYSYDLLRLVYRCYDQMDEVGRVRPVLSLLAERFGEATHYARLDGPEVVYVAKTQSPGAGLQITSVIGGRNPAHCTGLGRALLSCALPDEAAVVEYIARYGPLERRTEHTLVDARALARDLAATRKRGYALDREESEAGINCLAIPVFLLPSPVPSGAISVTALARRTPLRMLEDAAAEIRAIITRELGDVLE
jgi:DNA-binding IclR family transcriptional regulator